MGSTGATAEDLAAGVITRGVGLALYRSLAALSCVEGREGAPVAGAEGSHRGHEQSQGHHQVR